MLMDGIWDLILNSKKYIWHQLHTLNGMVVDLINPPHEWRFLSSGNPQKIVKKIFYFEAIYTGMEAPQCKSFEIPRHFLFFLSL